MTTALSITRAGWNWIRSGNMLPCFSSSRPTGRHYSHTKTGSQSFQRSWRYFTSFISDSANSFFRQLSQMLLLTMGPTTSAFLSFVIRIGLIVPQEQMRWPNASSVIAMMKYQTTWGNGTMFPFPRNAMSRKGSICLASFFPSWPNMAIATSAPISYPNPTTSFDVGDLWPIEFDMLPKIRRFWVPEIAGGSAHGLCINKSLGG